MTEANKPLPYDFLAEKAIIGSIIKKNETFDKANQIIKPVDFYDSRTQRIYKSIVTMFEKDIKVDEVSLLSQLRNENILQEVGGEEFITEITLSSFYTPNIDTYAKTVKEKALLRSLIGASEDIMDLSYRQNEDVSSILSMAESKIFDISQNKLNEGLIKVGDTLDETVQVINELSLNDGNITGVTTGLETIDIKLSGLQPSQLILLAARPAMGKTALGLTMAWNAAKEGKSVAFFSLEMSTLQLNYRLLSMVSMIDLEQVMNGRIKDDEWELLFTATKQIAAKDLYVDETPGITLSEMRSKLKRLKAEVGVDLVVIDYLQLMQADGYQENRQNEIASISRGLKTLSKELNCPILSLAQLSREADKRADHKPILSDLRESGAIEQDADVVMLLYREDYYDEEDNPNIAKVIVAKHRNGATGILDLFFNKPCTTFRDLSYKEENV
ncbi:MULTISPECIES: replicative DNA helicase [Anaerococcus]|uniref:Replicative DNA helicase n=1 Tax=Anaerococcus octavius TaxID=54007 RepID=A0A380WV31_9FIRM|nr:MULTISPECIES: replicative DNA helicase [Anaerococcus]MDU2598277.1 replicative DNA helicase [Anaerococcus sp.]MDU4025595.1 replicative DNA helicase [Anaerococcus sp.]MDU5229330.1 replicative DNA helicase [Anaerococcus sp.]MDU7412104.1 replicative DNA helicase [Anaerococcus sp.]SUU92042.1 Replicative DNA helicase [Anaerococcus octavius]